MDQLHLVIVVIFSFAVFEGSEACANNTATCCHPAEPTDNGEIYQITETLNSYNVDEVVGYACETGNGYMSIKCMGNNEWTTPERHCDDRIPFSYGSLAGILFAVFNICLEVSFISIATRQKKLREKEEQIEMSAAQSSRA